LSNLFWYLIRATLLNIRKSAKKQQSQLQTIQRRVTAKRYLKITVIYTNAGKVVAGFAVNA